MKELRCLVFNDNEVISAIFDRRRRRREHVPAGRVTGVTFRTHDTFTTILNLMDDDGPAGVETVDEEETLASVLAYCMSMGIPMPATADKFLYLVNGALTLMITLNFNRAPRLVFGPRPDKRSGEGRTRDLRRIVPI